MEPTSPSDINSTTPLEGNGPSFNINDSNFLSRKQNKGYIMSAHVQKINVYVDLVVFTRIAGTS